MLNRRQVRIRAVQALYAYKRSERANLDLAIESIGESFAPDLNSMKFQDKEKLDSDKKEALLVLHSFVAGRKRTPSDDNIKHIVEQAHVQYVNRCDKDKLYFIARAVTEAEAVYDHYLSILQLFVVLAKKAEPNDKLNGRFKLIDNQLIKALAGLKEFEHQCLRRNISWDRDDDFVTKFYREALKQNEQYDEYMAERTHTIEEDFAILKYLIKNVVLKHEISFEFFEEKDLYWADSIDLIRSMLTQTFEGLLAKKETALETLDDRWYEVRDFMTDLIKKALSRESELNEIITPKLKDWELDRINSTDEYIIKIALIEFLEYPSVPVKVTINEAVELSKLFSTPKNGIFVNGILDSIEKELSAAGTIKKSGRGLIDNR
jgi:transcription antitermination protein NusB